MEHFFLQQKFINIKYIFLHPFFNSFKTSIKYINTIYAIFIKIHKRVQKSNLISRNSLSKATRKPWPQKGLGKARSGSFKSPLWRGGSVLFGPKSKTLSVILQKKKNKLGFVYLLLNKRTYISFAFLMPLVHSFNNAVEHLSQQRRIQGCFSQKSLYVLVNNIKHKRSKESLFIYINSLGIISFLKFDYIIFLI